MLERLKPGPDGLARRFGALARESGARGYVWLLLDTSASMADGRKLTQAVQGTEAFVDSCCESNLRAGVITFGEGVRCLWRPTTRPSTARLATIEAAGRTPMARAIAVATRLLSRRSGEKVICILSDGLPDDRTKVLLAATTARTLGITLFAIGTEGADLEFVRSLAGRPSLAFWFSSGELARGLRDVAQSLPGKT
jgi:Mg-chelatase subunit ChlD